MLAFFLLKKNIKSKFCVFLLIFAIFRNAKTVFKKFFTREENKKCLKAHLMTLYTVDTVHITLKYIFSSCLLNNKTNLIIFVHSIPTLIISLKLLHNFFINPQPIQYFSSQRIFLNQPKLALVFKSCSIFVVNNQRPISSIQNFLRSSKS